jgi:hypothetical protein
VNKPSRKTERKSCLCRAIVTPLAAAMENGAGVNLSLSAIVLPVFILSISVAQAQTSAALYFS